MTSERAELVRRYNELADDALATAQRELPFSPVATINRAYYAAFYAALALFASEDKRFSKHTAFRAAIHQHLIKPDRLAPEIGTLFDQLFEARTDSDYDALARLGAADAASALSRAQTVVAALRAVIRRSEPT